LNKRKYNTIMIYEIIHKELHKATTSRYKISQLTGVRQPTLHKIYHKQQKAIESDVADTLLNFFGYEIVKKGKK
jgi:hypothetical protein